jgi:enoyl-CoA hydratase
MDFTPASPDDIRASTKDGVLEVVINRPEKRNPLSLGVLQRLRGIFLEASADLGLRFATITGMGEKAFASGGDVSELMSVTTSDQARFLTEHGKAALNAVRNFPVPVVACLNGVALGGGAELAVACDLRFAAAHATIGFIHSRLAIAPSWGGSIDLVRLLGYGTALRMMTRCEILDAEAALKIGLFDGVTPAGQTLEQAFAEFTAVLRTQPPQVMRAMKAAGKEERMLNRAAAESVETENFVNVWVHDDHWAAIAAGTKKTGAK